MSKKLIEVQSKGVDLVKVRYDLANDSNLYPDEWLRFVNACNGYSDGAFANLVRELGGSEDLIDDCIN